MPLRCALLFVFALACGSPERGPPCDPGTICTAAGIGEAAVGVDGAHAHSFGLYFPTDVTALDDRLYVADFNNHRVIEVELGGAVRVIAGTGFIGDGPPGPA